MKKFPVVSVVVIIVGLVLAGMAGNALNSARMRNQDDVRVKNRGHVSRLGLDKYIADLKWVRIIQQMGRVEGALTDRAAAYFAGEIDSITNLDPTMKEAYEIGVWQIASLLPDQALKLLDKANRLSLERDWRWHSAAGYIAERYKKDHNLALTHYRLAGDTGGQPAHVDRAWLRLATRDAGEDRVGRLLAQHRSLKKLVKETVQEYAVEGDEEIGQEVSTNFEEMGENTRISRLTDYLIGQSRNITSSLLEQIAGENDSARKAQLNKELAQVKNVFEDMRKQKTGNMKHNCSNCLTGYGPGQFFCSSCGHNVAGFGHCGSCWSKGSLVLVHGGFCHICGSKADSAK